MTFRPYGLIIDAWNRNDVRDGRKYREGQTEDGIKKKMRMMRRERKRWKEEKMGKKEREK